MIQVSRVTKNYVNNLLELTLVYNEIKNKIIKDSFQEIVKNIKESRAKLLTWLESTHLAENALSKSLDYILNLIDQGQIHNLDELKQALKS
jgi:Ran GTPase-activating protein (RanGAP) involved in mRNA processing and transport